MADVIWSDIASEQLEEIIAYIEAFDPHAAEGIGARLFRLGESLTDFPNRGRPAPGGARELATVEPFVLRYRVDGDVVVIVQVRHGRRRPIKT